jgi:hypothetical protein
MVGAVWLLEGIRAYWVAINDIVCISWGNSARNIIEPSKLAHPVRNRMIRAGRVAAYAKPTDHLPIIIVERDTSAKCDDPSGDPAYSRRGRIIENGIERV